MVKKVKASHSPSKKPIKKDSARIISHNLNKKSNLRRIRHILANVKKPKVNKERLVADLLHCVVTHLYDESQYRSDPFYKEFWSVCVEAQRQIVDPVLQKKIKTSYKNEEMGYFVMALIKLGASKLDAQEFASGWTGIKFPTIHAAYTNLPDRKHYETLAKEEFFRGAPYAFLRRFYDKQWIRDKHGIRLKKVPSTTKKPMDKYVPAREAFFELQGIIEERDKDPHF